jgi:hypothetical protein
MTRPCLRGERKRKKRRKRKASIRERENRRGIGDITDIGNVDKDNE